MDARKVVGENVRRYRDAAGMTQAALAAAMEVDRAYVSGLELGQRNPTVVTLWHVALALRIKPYQLLEESPAFTPKPKTIGAKRPVPRAKKG